MHTQVRTLVSEVIGQTLADLGVTRVFGVVGSGNFEATDALVRAGATFVGTRHEAAATGAADAHWRASGTLAVCTVHQGPGLTNTLTALADAAKARSPLVVIAGATSAGAWRSNFFIDQARLVEAAGGIAERIHGADTAADDVRRAHRRALVERRPVVLDMPLDLQRGIVDGPGEDRAPADGPGPEDVVPRTVPAGDVVGRVVDHLLAARSPVIVAGRGAWLSGARDAVAELADRLGATLATTALAKGMFDGHPADVGIAGGFSFPPAVRARGGADLVLALGASLTTWTTRGDTIFAQDPVVIQVDDDASQLCLNGHVDQGVLGDVRETVLAVLRELGSRPGQADGGAGAGANPARAASGDLAGVEDPEVRPADGGAPGSAAEGRCHPGHLTHALERILPAERTLVVDGGHFIGWPVRGLRVPDPAGFVFSSAGFQSIGLGIGAAIGAAAARPDRLTVLAAGDGGLLMSLPELETLARIGSPVAVVVYNDAAYGAEVHHFRGLGSGMELVQFPETDFAAVAQTLGITATVVRGEDDLEPFARWCADPRGVFLVDARIDPDIVGPWAEQDFLGH
jgi:thiamine pyrophosphate-dependent acetolactate synthase large subunit-like protein